MPCGEHALAQDDSEDEDKAEASDHENEDEAQICSARQGRLHL